jgi:type II secretory pathway pseudopilin PulG
MNTMDRPIARIRSTANGGFSLIEILVSMGITVSIMGATMQTMTHAIRANQAAMLVTGMNSSLRTGMDVMVRDLLQVGQGLPNGGVIFIPLGSQMNLPGPPGQVGVTGGTTSTPYTSVVGDPDISAVTPGPGLGQLVNGVRTDMLTTLAADSAFDHRTLSAIAADGSSMTVALVQPDGSASDISNGGPDDIIAGQLFLLTKGSTSTLVQVTSVDGAQTAFFATGDSLNLNKPAAAAGSIGALLATAPTDNPAPRPGGFVPPTQATRIRMISYYIDATTATGYPAPPRLVRRMNNGTGTSAATAFNNKLGNTVAFDVDNLQITYDLNDGVNNPSNVRMIAADLAGTGACSPNACAATQIRKVNIILTARSKVVLTSSGKYYHNTLNSQVSLRSLSFVDRYK